MSEWQVKSLEDFVSINPRESLAKGSLAKKIGMEYLQPYVKKVSGYQVEEYKGGTKFRNGDTLLARITPCLENGKTAYVNILDSDEVAFGSTEYIVLRELQEVSDKQFIYYFSRSEYFRDIAIALMTGSSGRQRVQTDSLSKYLFEFPLLPEQKAIANVLSSLDDKIDLLQRQNETLEKMAEALFRQWFIEEAKDDWELSTFDKWVLETKGGDWGKEAPIDDFTKAVYCLRGTDIANLQKNMSINAPLRFIKDKKFDSIEPDNGDIVIEISGGTETQSTGRSYYINDGVKKLFTQPLVFSNFCRLIKIRHVNYSYFVYLYLKFLYDTDEFFALENGSSGIKNLNYKAILFELKFLMPTIERVLEFNEIIENNFIKIDENRIQIQTLQNLRDTLLPKLMSGEVRVELD